MSPRRLFWILLGCVLFLGVATAWSRESAASELRRHGSWQAHEVETAVVVNACEWTAREDVGDLLRAQERWLKAPPWVGVSVPVCPRAFTATFGCRGETDVAAPQLVGVVVLLI